MMQIFKKTSFDFVGKRKTFFAISGGLILIAILSLCIRGMNMGLDFTGGTLMQVHFEKFISTGDLRAALVKNNVEASIQSFSDSDSFQIKVKGAQTDVNAEADKITNALNETVKDNKFTVEKLDYVGPVVGKDLSRKAIFAIVLSMMGIILYVAFRFSNPIWGGCGVIALFHDVLIALGALSLTGREIDLVVVAALLTLVGYSINDTVVIFDRMRENLRTFPKMPLGELINVSLNETLSRTVITSITVFMVVLILFLFGGDVINNFAFTMLIGTICGTYSTIAIAVPLVYTWANPGKK
ncbi:MAG: protein translocase subunit SecF [Elusimicrobiales bacterium]|nr:protein translocase subunit SecF [Elusimicrobiales bacterium]